MNLEDKNIFEYLNVLKIQKFRRRKCFKYK